MIQSGEVYERHIIPRWTPIKTSNELGELAPINKPVKSSPNLFNNTEHLESLLYDWYVEPNLPLAIEILSAARFSDDTIDMSMIRDYAIHAVKNMDSVPPLLLDVLDNGQSFSSVPCYPLMTSKNEVYATIASLKRSLIQFPRSPLDWCELARQYLIIGQTKQSEHALQVAYGLAPNYRTVLRALARFYSHINDPEKGLYYLRSSSILRSDPWVLSSEIALANELHRTSKLVKRGCQLIEDTNINPSALSELASELGTMDFLAGNKKRGRKKFEIAKIIPHENSVAQMVWINQRVCNIESIISTISAEPKYNYEADAKWSIAQENWLLAIDTICKWQGYQPFSKIPVMEGSYIATDFLDDPQKAILILEQGRLSNPNDISLLNNLIYSLIIGKEFDRAYDLLESFNPRLPIDDEQIPLIATYGLYCYRCGNPDDGRPYYRLAIDHAMNLNQIDTAYRATVYFAREEKRIGADISQQLDFLNNEKYKSNYLEYLPLIKKFGLDIL